MSVTEIYLSVYWRSCDCGFDKMGNVIEESADKISLS